MINVSPHYLWWILSLVLIAGEVLAPGYFLLWVGLAAAAMGAALLVAPDLGLLAQAVLFGAFSFAFCYVYARWIRSALESRSAGSEKLNRRGDQLIGQRYQLIEAIANGRGKAAVGDGQWLVSGPDTPAGAIVEVVSVEGSSLLVKLAE